MAKPIPNQANVVVIGGGVIGTSLAYHLAKAGERDVVLLERKQLTCGTTWHAAGLIGQIRSTYEMTQLALYTTDLYKDILRDETGQDTGYRQNGGIGVAADAEKFEEIKRLVSTGKAWGLEIDLVTPEEIKNLWPLINTDDLYGGFYTPTEGQASPVDVTNAFAAGARALGAQIFEGVKVTAIHQANGKVTGVSTSRGDIKADVVVNCGGMWGREIGKMAGVNVPLHACEHFYVHTEKMDADVLPPTLPTLREQGASAYYREDAGSLLIGFFEPVAKPWGMGGIADDHSFETLPEDWDHLMPQLEMAMHRVPQVGETEIRSFFNGPESFTPDDQFHMGEAPNLKNFFVACGFNSIGIQSGGVMKALAEWIIQGYPPYEMWVNDIRRVYSFQGTDRYLHDRVSETLGLLYAHHYPYRQYESSRNVRQVALHEKWQSLNACFGETAGWERPNWFAPDGVEPKYDYSFGRQNWFEYSAAEHNAVRNNVGLIELSTFAKIDVDGKDACAALQNICTNNVDVEPGRMVYTQWLNARGGIEADLTVTRLAENSFRVTTSAATSNRELNWLAQNIPDDAHCFAKEVTTAYSILGLMGPNARKVLSKLTSSDLSLEGFPFARAREIEIGCVPVLACRITYVGELGWELVIPAEMSRHVFDLVWEAGAEFGMKPVGMHAMDSLRLEKAYRHFGHDINDGDSPVQAGLTFACKLRTDIPFIGRDVVERQRDEGVDRLLVQFKLDESEPLLLHNEPVFRDGDCVGYLTSGNYGHYLGAAMGLGYVTNKDGLCTPEFINAGSYEIEVSCERFSATASLAPMHDPRNERIKC
ncbi:MAG: FAD-dependent oxidoreductase [Pseudomonadota bacterium]